MRAHARGKIHRRRNSKEERDEREVGVRACVFVIRIENRGRIAKRKLSPRYFYNIVSSIKNKKKKQEKF